MGKKVYEVRPPVDWNKSKALQHIVDRYGGDSRRGPVMSFYLGDDLTDEDGFRAVNRLGGASVDVGEASHSSEAGIVLHLAMRWARFSASWYMLVEIGATGRRGIARGRPEEGEGQDETGKAAERS